MPECAGRPDIKLKCGDCETELVKGKCPNCEDGKNIISITGFKSCDGMRILIKNGMVKIRRENIDEKGEIITVVLVGPRGDSFGETISIKHCPVCGNKISNLMVPEGKCENYDLCDICQGIMIPGPDGPWCKTCDPDAPIRFHVEESGPFQ